MNCVKITKQAADLFKFFGFLQFGMLEMKPSLIAMSLVKFKIGYSIVMLSQISVPGVQDGRLHEVEGF
jgi:hypothetical protein